MRSEPRSNIEWRSWGAIDPLFGVSSLPGRGRHGERPWTTDEFYAYGALTWSEYVRHWEAYGVNRDCCVEIGCGAGRITKQLASYFQRVHAIDVSRDMIALAREHVGAENVTYCCTDGRSLPLADTTVTAAFSCDVFQHFARSRDSEAYFHELWRVLGQGSSLMIHLSVYAWPDQFPGIYQKVHRVVHFCDHLYAEVRRRLIQVGLGKPFLYGVSYHSRWLFDLLSNLGFRDVEVRFFATSSLGARPSLRSYLFAHKG